MELMKVKERGVMPESNIYFNTPGEEGLKLFLYPICCGHFICGNDYRVNRTNYDSFLLMYVKRGEGFVGAGEGKKYLTANDVILLDCYRPHAYGTESGWEILWAHFDGKQARDYFEAVSQGSGCVLLSPQMSQNVYGYLHKIYELFHEICTTSDTLGNKYLVNILTEFLMCRGAAGSGRATGITDDLLTYISENIRLPLKLKEIAARVSLSPYYFTRLFKKEVGYTPHRYILMARINSAKFYLKSSELPVKEVARNCGFASESGFCVAFKRIVGMTPKGYRNQHM